MKTKWNCALKNQSTIQFISSSIFYLLLNGKKMYATERGCWLPKLKMSIYLFMVEKGQNIVL